MFSCDAGLATHHDPNKDGFSLPCFVANWARMAYSAFVVLHGSAILLVLQVVKCRQHSRGSGSIVAWHGRTLCDFSDASNCSFVGLVATACTWSVPGAPESSRTSLSVCDAPGSSGSEVMSSVKLILGSYE